jgi:hypothetical protein
MTARTLILTLVVVLAGVAGVSGIGAAGTYDIDDGHDLDCTAFNDTGESTDELVSPNANITISESHDNIGVGKAYFKIDYEEDIEHTLRVYIPSSCVSPYAKDTVEEHDGGPNAEYAVVDNGKYLSITVTLDETGEYVYPISKSKGVGFDVWDGLSDRSPFSGGDTGGEWKYPEQNELHDYGSVTIDTDTPDDMRVERQDGDRWLVVTDDPGDADVFVDRSEDSVTIVSTVNDPPDVRYNKQPDSTDSVAGVGSDVGKIFDNIGSDLKGLTDKLFNKSDS